MNMSTETYRLSIFHVSEVICTVSQLIKNQNILLTKEYLKHGIVNIKQIDISPLNLVAFYIIFWVFLLFLLTLT